MSTLKVGTIQDHANSNTAISIDSSGNHYYPSITLCWSIEFSILVSGDDKTLYSVGYNEITFLMVYID